MQVKPPVTFSHAALIPGASFTITFCGLFSESLERGNFTYCL